jgi:hypothetical protein
MKKIGGLSLNESSPEQNSVFSLRRSYDERRNNGHREFKWLIVTGTLLFLTLLLLILMQFASVAPILKFGFLLLGLGIAALILIRQSYAEKNLQPSKLGGRERHEGKDALQSTIENLDQAFEGDPFRQMLALQELKELLIDRLVLRKHLSRSEVLERASDRNWLEKEIDQVELRLLLATDLKESYATELSHSTSQQDLIFAFPNNYRRILELLEEM